MKVGIRFLALSLLWGAGFFLLLSVPTWGGPSSGENRFLNFPALMAGGLGMAAFPAGIGVARFALRRPFSWPDFISTLSALLLLSGAILVLTGYVSPLVNRMVYPVTAGQEVSAGASYLHELPSQVREAFRAAEANPEDLASWRDANVADMALQIPFSQGAKGFFLGAVGLMLGFWGGWIRTRGVRHGFWWGVGLFLVVSTYLFGENAFELLLIRLMGPNPFLAFIPVSIPSLIFLGLLVPTVMVLLVDPQPGPAGGMTSGDQTPFEG